MSELCILINQWQAHREQICSISRIERPNGFITASTDRHVKIWSREGKLWGEIATYGENPVIFWQFPYDWTEDREKEKDRVVSMLKDIEPENNIDKNTIRFEDAEARKIRYTKKGQWDRIIPKRSLIKPIGGNEHRHKSSEVLHRERASNRQQQEDKALVFLKL